MEPVTHLLTGATLSRAGFNRKTALATLTMTLAAEAPDLDVLAYFKGSDYGFIQHRGISHTVFAVPVLAALIVGAIWLVDAPWQRHRRARGLPPPPERRWGWLFLLACIAGLSHLLLDFTNNYGIRPLYPFMRQWYAWDIVFIFEPLIFAALLSALLLPRLFALVNQEIGARPKSLPGRSSAIAALLFIVATWGVRDVEHRRAVAALGAVEYQGEPALRVAAFPYMVNPFQWAGVAETSHAYISLRVDSLHSEDGPGDAAETYYKPQPTEASLAAQKTELGRFYLHWARFPLVEDEELSEPAPSHLVHLLDVRFIYPDSRRHPLVAYVLLDSNLRLIEEGFDASQPRR